MSTCRNFTHTPNSMNPLFMLSLWGLRASIDTTTKQTAIPLVSAMMSLIARSTNTLRPCSTWASNSQSAQPIVGMYTTMELPITSSKTRTSRSCKITCHYYPGRCLTYLKTSKRIRLLAERVDLQRKPDLLRRPDPSIHTH